jgi:hypothetical protein
MRLVSFILALIVVQTSMHAAGVQDIWPRPKVCFEYPGQEFRISPQTPVIIPSVPASPAYQRAINKIQNMMKKLMGDTVQVLSLTSIPNTGPRPIIIGEAGKFRLADSMAALSMPAGESLSSMSGAYMLDISPQHIMILGADTSGIFNAITVLQQLSYPGNASMGVFAAHILDYPDYPIRWAYSMHNLRNPASRQTLHTVLDTMEYYRMNGLQHGDFAYDILDYVPVWYADTAASIARRAQNSGIEMIPQIATVGWASGILYNNPNLASGVMAKALYRIEGDTGRLISDSRMQLSNGGFESIGANKQFTGWSFYDDPGIVIMPDSAIRHSGKYSARCSGFRQNGANSAGNARISRRLNCNSNTYYTMSVWIRTQNYSGGFIQLLALGTDSLNNSRQLTYTNFQIPSTTNTAQNNGWIQAEVRFNTLNYTTVSVYAGIWGGQNGTVWFDDFSVQQAGLCNILRRPGTPVQIKNKNSGILYAENKDIDSLVDAIMLQRRGNYGRWHQGPVPRLKAGSGINNGDTLEITYYHPLTVVADIDNNGSTMCTLSDEEVYKLIGSQSAKLQQFYSPHRFFLAHDEIRLMNRDQGELSRGLSPAEILADNIRRCDSIATAHGSMQNFIWSDMLDSLHNATNNYYLINGDLRGIWNQVPKSLIIANWNSGRKDQSLAFFDKLGFRQVSCPYYDAGTAQTIRSWRLAGQNIPGYMGGIYTTWQDDFSFLRAFAGYFWSAGPALMHRPPDSIQGNLLSLDIIARPDPYDAADSIQWVRCTVLGMQGDSLGNYTFQKKSNNSYTVNIPVIPAMAQGFKYRIYARNMQGLQRILPDYIIGQKNTLAFITQPADQSRCIGDTAIFTASVQGQNPQMQWQCNGNDVLDNNRIIGSKTNSLKLLGVQPADTACQYSLKIMQASQSIQSASVRLNLIRDIRMNTLADTVIECKNADSVLLWVYATGDSLRYQWQHKGVDIPGAVSNSLPIIGISAKDTGNYRCKIQNPCAISISRQFTLMLKSISAILQDDMEQHNQHFMLNMLDGSGYLHNPMQKLLYYTICDATGRRIYSMAVQPGQGIKLDMAGPAGLYALYVQDGSGRLCAQEIWLSIP